MTDNNFKIVSANLNFYYGGFQALYNINMKFAKKEATSLIGPSGCGKSTYLRCLNRMNDLIPGTRIDGKILMDGEDIYDPSLDVVLLRRRIGMVFQKPNPFPKTIFENIAYGMRVNGIKDKAFIEASVEKSLIRAALWEEVKDRLRDSAFNLSGGQQQRLCIARALAVEPEVILLDEPTSSLDPASTKRIEELLKRLSRDYTIVIVTHNVHQAMRLAEHVVFIFEGRIVEQGDAEEIFKNPRSILTKAYIKGDFS